MSNTGDKDRMNTNPIPNDDLIGDFINLKIGEELSLSMLFAIEAIFYLRLQLAQVEWDDNEPIYESLCRDRFEQISKVLTGKYKSAETLNEKIGILYHLENISQTLSLGINDFVVEKRRELLSNCQYLTFPQRYRLDNMLEFNYDNIKEDIDRLILETETAFDISILFDIDSLGTPNQYAAVMDLYEAIFTKAVSEGNTSEIARLLVAAVYCNSDPDRRRKITELTDQLIANNELRLNLPLPVVRVNAIAAEIYTRIDRITGKYEILSA